MGFYTRLKDLFIFRKSRGFVFAPEPVELNDRHVFYVRIPEDIEPVERGQKYVKPLDAALAGVGEVTGGGTQMGEGNTIEFVGLDVEVIDRDRGLEIIRQTLRACGAPAGTVIEENEPEYRELPL